MESPVNENDPIPSDLAETNEIRTELSKMSFEDLKRLKEKLGLKIYKEAMFGKQSSSDKKFKRENKNRPREVSSKIKPRLIVKASKSKTISDPRFNRLCGEFNKTHFKNTYGFLSEMQKNEKKQLKKMLKKSTNEMEQKKLKYLIQRMENQEFEEIKLQKKLERKEQERKEQIKALESGVKPHFKTKFEKKIVNLIDKYSALKKTGKIENYIKKKQKKLETNFKKPKRYYEVNLDEK